MIRVPQPDGSEAIICGERCWLKDSDQIDKLRRWVMQPIEPSAGKEAEDYIDPASLGWSEKDCALRCVRMIMKLGCDVPLDVPLSLF